MAVRSRRSTTIKKPASTQRYWVLDNSVSKCSICETTFSFLVRRHHCRSCGKIFCDQCTSTKRPLKNLGYNTPVRLCDICAKDIKICTEDQVKYEQTTISHSALIKEWVFLVTTVDLSKELERKILNGIPNTLRCLVWAELCNATSLIAKNGGIYEVFLSRPNQEADEPISHDIPRTILDHPRFGTKGSQNNSIANVLHAYANFNPSIGYSQGMAWIVAALLMHMNEESAFWVFVQMMKNYSLSSFYSKEEEEIEVINHFVNSFRTTMPQLEQHIIAHGGEPSMFARHWIRTLFVTDFDLAVVFRLWDIFFVEKMQFLLNFILTMFSRAEEKILALSGPQTLVYINNLPIEFHNSNIDDLISLSVKNHTSVRFFGTTLLGKF